LLEVLIPGKSCFGYTPFDALQLLQAAMGIHPEHPDTPDYASFESYMPRSANAWRTRSASYTARRSTTTPAGYADAAAGYLG